MTNFQSYDPEERDYDSVDAFIDSNDNWDNWGDSSYDKDVRYDSIKNIPGVEDWD